MRAPDRVDWSSPESRLYHLLGRVVDLLVRAVVDLRVIGADRLLARGPAVLAPNHPSHFETIVTAVTFYRCGRKPRFLALSSLFQHPVAGPVLRLTRMIPVHRGKGVAQMVEDACAALEAGEAVVVYPEGQLAPRGVEAPARPGAGLLALRSPGPVVPVATVGLEPGRQLLRRRAVVLIGEPVDLSEWKGRRDRDAQQEASGHLLGRIKALRATADGILTGRLSP